VVAAAAPGNAAIELKLLRRQIGVGCGVRQHLEERDVVAKLSECGRVDLDDAGVRRDETRLQARIGAPADRDLLRRALGDRSAGARRAAAEGLGRLGDRESFEAIQRLSTSDSSDVVRLAAAFGLHQLGLVQSHTIASMLVVDDLRDQAREYLFDLGRAAVPGIQSVLEVATTARHRADLLQTVGYVGALDDVAVVEPFLKDRDERVVRAATNAILRLRRP
jgi:HEAT repeat protein